MTRAAALAVLLLSAACSAGGPAASPRPSPPVARVSLGEVRVGALFPTSGAAAAAGLDALHGVELAADVLDGAHPEIGLPRMTVGRIALDVADTRGDADGAVAAVDRLVASHAVALTGALQSPATAAASLRAERLGVPMVSGSASAADLTERSLRWFWRVGPSDRTYVDTYFAWLRAIRGRHPVTRAVVVHADDAAHRDGAALIGRLAPPDVAISENVALPAGDLTPQVLRLEGYGADAVFALAPLDAAMLLVRTMARVGYTPPALLALGDEFGDPQFTAGLGPLADYVVTQAAWSAEIGRRRPLAAAVAGAFRQKYGRDMTGDSARDFEAMMTLGMAIEAADSTDPVRIRAALARTDVSATIMGWRGIRFDGNGQNALASGVIEQVVNGRYDVVYPTEVASASVAWPMPSLGRRV